MRTPRFRAAESPPAIPGERPARAAGFRLMQTALLLLPLACASDTPTGNTGEDGVLRFERYDVPAGETREYPAGTTIVAASGVRMDGDIEIDGSLPGDFRIKCESGTLEVRGSIVVKPGTSETPRPAGVMSEAQAPLKGTTIVLESTAPGGWILVGGSYRSGDGPDGLPTDLLGGSGRIEGDPGGDAGDVIVLTFGGTIELASGPAAHLEFFLGQGGRGGDIIVGRDNYEPDPGEPSLQVVAGRGGDSGRLALEADRILNRPAVQDTVHVIRGGMGGDGGHALWDASEEGILLSSTPLAGSRTYLVNQIVMEGGRGGDGAVRGGNGGHAAYWGAAINERDDPVAPASAYGGDGGDVFGSPLPIAVALGGHGGGYVVHGNDGWDGAHPDSVGPRDGADGGAVIGRGGDGGDVRSDVTCAVALGGDGGHTTASRTALPLVFQTDFTAPDSYVYGVIGGRGGAGTSRCDDCPGGDGGNNGLVTAIGGSGGNVLATPAQSLGGRGGDTWYASGTASGQGGIGNPPGAGGKSSATTVVPGLGGSALTPGLPGLVLQDPLVIPDGEDGVLCDPEGDECAEEIDPEDPVVCTEGMFTIDSHYSRTVGENSTKITISVTGEVTPDGWTWSDATYVRTDVIDGESNTGTRKATEGEVGALVETASQPYCGGGFSTVQWADQGGLILDCDGCTYSIVLYGCNPYGIGLEGRERFSCCPRPNDDGYYVCVKEPGPTRPE